MKIKKFLHSCLLVEDNGKRLLLDPGGWSSPVEEIGPVDVIVITHEHADHFDIAKIKELLKIRSAKIVTNSNISKLLALEKIESFILEGGQRATVNGFEIEGVVAPHGDLPVPKPINVGYIINKMLFSPGDSFTFELPNLPPVLALPIAAPWGTTTDAVALGLRLKPKHIIPVHEQVYNPLFIPRVFTMCAKIFRESAIEFHPLEPDESLEI